MRVYLRKGEEIVATDVSGGGNADLAMVAGQERQRGLIERDIKKWKRSFGGGEIHVD